MLTNPRPDGRNFRAAVGIYGRCHDLPRSRAIGIPLMQLAGELDRNHVDACRAAGPPIEVHILPGAYHSWDDMQASGKLTSYGDTMLYDYASTERSKELVRTFLTRQFAAAR
jgi:dienelactone hydrolase